MVSIREQNELRNYMADKDSGEIKKVQSLISLTNSK